MKKITGREKIIELLWKLLEDNTSGELKSILSGKPLVYYFGDEFAEEFMQKRVEKNISLQSLRLTDTNYDTQKHKDYSGYLKEIQHINTPESIDGDVIFMQDETVIIFHVEDMTAQVYSKGEVFSKYRNLFEKYWDS